MPSLWQHLQRNKQLFSQPKKKAFSVSPMWLLMLAVTGCFLLHPLTSSAANERSATYLQANRFQQGAILLLKDNKIYGPGGYISGWKSEFDIKRTDNLVSLMINPAAKDYGKYNFSVKLDLQLVYKDSENNLVKNADGKDTTGFSLEVNYNKNARQGYRQQDVFHFTGGHHVLVKVAGVTITGSDTSGLTDLVMLKSEMRVERYYPLAGSKVKNLSHNYFSQDNELLIRWQDMTGAEQYELEYTFVDNYDYTPGPLSSPGSKSSTKVWYDFNEYSQRIRLDENHYRIPIVYEQGYLVYRVRPLGRGGKNFEKIVYGKWTKPDRQRVALAAPNVYSVSGNKIHESDKKNWLYKASFTEEGNRLSNIIYFDGSNRDRQSLTQISGDDYVLVSEKFYDYEGRAAVNVMSAPAATASPSPAIYYYHKFNQNQQGEKYSRKDFDEIKAAGCGLDRPAPMSSSSGAAKYYSSNNNMPDEFIDRLPKSEGYPFSQTSFVPYKKNLPKRQSSSGKELQLGSDHEVKFMYSTSPMQIELDRMFGTEAGKAEHYRKVIMFDENSQAHVKYMNNKGNIVAKGLTGAPAPNLAALPDDQVDQVSLTGEVLQSENERRGLQWIANHQFVVTTANTAYTFKYNLDPSKFEKQLCNGQSICYDGIYDVSIVLKDECGNVIRDTSANVGDLSELDSNCDNYADVSLSINSGPLKKGSYSISKVLSLNPVAVEAYMDSFAQNSCFQAIYDSIHQEELDNMDTANCVQGCGDVASQKVYTDTLPNGEVITDTLTDEEQGQLQARINSVCGGGTNLCQSAYNMLLSDISPGGQYAKYYDSTKTVRNGDTVPKGTHPEAFPLSVLNKSNRLPGSGTSWKSPTQPYRDTTGEISWLRISSSLPPDYVEQNKIVMRDGIGYVKPQHLIYVSDFIDYWQDSWAKSLVEYHPEYCYYEYCSQYPASNEFDKDLLMTGRYSKAVEEGFITGNQPKLLANDPYFQQQPALKQKMQDTLQNLIDLDSASFSLIEVVISMEYGCNVFACIENGDKVAGVKQCIQDNMPLFTGKDSSLQNRIWKNYRAIYFALKQSIFEKERHKYALNSCGKYNGCIGVKNERYRNQDRNKMSELTDTIGLFPETIYHYPQPCHWSVSELYSSKQKRFPDGDDLYDYMDGIQRPSASTSMTAQAENLESFVDNYMKRECDKCPQEVNLESFLNELAINGQLTGSEVDANKAIASCELVENMNLPAITDGYLWSANTTNRELQGTILGGMSSYCNVQLYDTSGSPVAWDSILMFTCLEHISNPSHYQKRQGQNFKVRAITKDHQVAWLEGKVSCMNLANCYVEPYCQPNEIADDLVPIFNRVFGLLPLLRKMMLESGNTQLANRVPVYPGSKLIVDNVPITQSITPALKSGHVEPEAPGYYWEVDTVNADTNALVAGIFGKEGCRFLMYSDTAHKLNQPFMVTDVIVNHPELETEGCEQKEFYLEARYFSFKQVTLSNGKTTLKPKYGETFLIRVQSECYSVAECCPEKDCPELTINGDFESGNDQFQSDLNYSEKLKGGSFYGMKSRMSLDSSHLAGQYQLGPNIIQQQPNLQIANNYQIQPFNTGTDTPGTNIPSQLQMPNLNQNISGILQNQNFNQLSNPMILQQMELQGQLPIGEIHQYDDIYVPGGVHLIESNDYLIFHPANKSEKTVWQQEVGINAGVTYKLTCRVRLVQAGGNFDKANMQWDQLLNFEVNGNTGSWQVVGNPEGVWVKLEATYAATTTGAHDLKITFAANDDYHQHIWAVDDISVEGVNCKNPMCCPPIMPQMPPNAYKNPCVEKKKEIAESNTDIIVDRFIRDTLRSVREEFIATVMDVDETLEKSYSAYDYPMTLYYFDQADNLIKTVPPKGYNPLDNSQAQQVGQNRRNGSNTTIEPGHTLVTTYKYNTLNEVVERNTPDGGTTRFWYDKLGRIVASQDAEQKRISDQTGGPNNIYNYILYDKLGRVIESGELRSAGNMSRQVAKNDSYFEAWVNGGQKHFIKRNYYDEPLSSTTDGYFGSEGQQFLRKRVATSTYDITDKDDAGDIHESYEYAIHYSYDVHGNVKTVNREATELKSINHHLKRIDYKYDLISGNVKMIIYQKGQPDQFAHKYSYDAANKLQTVHTSRNGLIWQQEARYFYFPHGALARVELGNESVQGMDFAYTLQGWLKGLNASTSDPNQDLGQDGLANSSHEHVAADATAFGHQYFTDDYQAGGTVASNAFSSFTASGNMGQDLYDGSISKVTSSNRGMNDLGLAYQYDQLSRLVQMQAFQANGNTFQSTQDYQSTYTYDANGNLKDVTRNGAAGSGPQQMDDLTYHYLSGTNQIDYIADQASDGAYNMDLDNQSNGNYAYDAAGRMTADQAAGINTVEWNNENRITTVKKGGETVNYGYGPDGKRVKKEAKNATIYYVRDSRGQVLAKYKRVKDTFELAQFNIYGNARLGIYEPGPVFTRKKASANRLPQPQKGINTNNKIKNPIRNIKQFTPMRKFSDTFSIAHGHRQYELKNHLNNVLATVSDRKMLDSSTGQFRPVVLHSTQYYPYGMPMPGRSDTSGYLYGFNGKEKDDDIYGNSTAYNFDARIYDARVGRWLSVDPMADSFSSKSPYLSMSGDPINRIDPDGMEDKESEDPPVYEDWKGEAFSFVLNDYFLGFEINPWINKDYKEKKLLEAYKQNLKQSKKVVSAMKQSVLHKEGFGSEKYKKLSKIEEGLDDALTKVESGQKVIDILDKANSVYKISQAWNKIDPTDISDRGRIERAKQFDIIFEESGGIMSEFTDYGMVVEEAGKQNFFSKMARLGPQGSQSKSKTTRQAAQGKIEELRGRCTNCKNQ